MSHFRGRNLESSEFADWQQLTATGVTWNGLQKWGEGEESWSWSACRGYTADVEADNSISRTTSYWAYSRFIEQGKGGKRPLKFYALTIIAMLSCPPCGIGLFRCRNKSPQFSRLTLRPLIPRRCRCRNRKKNFIYSLNVFTPRNKKNCYCFF